MKNKKSRVQEVGVHILQGALDVYFLTVPYDKKKRIIPSSVECAYNSRYFSLQQTINMLGSL